MCGIVAAASQSNIISILADGLKHLEYRGYDSSGIAFIQNKNISSYKKQGNVSELTQSLDKKLNANIGIAHTRWATHGKPSKENAHPHISNNNIAIVHNGIIENHLEIKNKFFKDLTCSSETDSEILAHLINFYRKENEIFEAVYLALKEVKGSYAIAVLDKKNPEKIIVARNGSPLLIGLGEKINFIASDAQALIEHTNKFVYLEDGDLATVTAEEVKIYNKDKESIRRETKKSKLSLNSNSKNGYKHYMLKEIFEQPEAVRATIQDRIINNSVPKEILGPNAKEYLSKFKVVQIIACGTSYHAALVAKHWLERLAGIPCHAEIASEFRYRRHAVQKDTLLICISQSGETADTLSALREIKEEDFYVGTIAVCNVPESSLARECDSTLITHAGPEIGVASTKAFTTQLAALMLLVIVLGKRFEITAELENSLCMQLKSLPEKIKSTLDLDNKVAELAKIFSDKEHALFLGRGSHFPIAREGALKLKEISYIHAESYAAGELKHGPLAIVDENMPVIAVAPNNVVLEKLKSNLEEVKARGGKLYIFADKKAGFKNDDISQVFEIDAPMNPVSPILFTIPLQLLAYHCAIIKGTNVDMPRNLAKSVTVE
ncbi:MAG: glutamine--fructose-6-phosphate transaminase (isomerizing) [Gammaproteobacteria bacterium]|nr:glutamine--fructose-6-phosphate transaminase (isomerizing) [Gammaproteobacteria bacterium]MBT7522948.1 glutamine--fructose-6-phosphate transaminase (isomerizing) [Gammaproteobacteria bacterium]